MKSNNGLMIGSQRALTVDELVEAAAESFGKHDYFGACDALKEALEHEPDRVDLRVFLGNVMYHMKDPEGACEQFRRVVDLEPGNVLALTSLAAALQAVGRIEETETVIKAAVNEDPENVGALKFLAALFLRMERHREACEVCGRLALKDPGDVENLLLWGRCCYELEDYSGADRAYQRVLEQDPENELAKENLGLVRQRCKHREPARSWGTPQNLACDENGVIQEISIRDEMFTGNREHYFGVGRSALNCVQTALAAAGLDARDVRDVLDLPCGHGRALRTLKAAFPDARFTACDLNRDGVDFCKATFRVEGIYSESDPDQLRLPRDYDLIWCGSLLTHLQSPLCSKFVRLFRSALRPGGLMIFSLGGRWVARNLSTGRYKYCLDDPSIESLLRQYRDTGFGYVDYPGNSGYGLTLASPSYVFTHWASFPDLKVVHFGEKAWDNHQDVICLQKQPEADCFD